MAFKWKYVTGKSVRALVCTMLVTWYLLLVFVIGCYSSDMDYAAVVLRARCMARCYDEFGVTVTESSVMGAEHTSLRVCEQYASCQQCVLPCDQWTPVAICTDLCPSDDTICADSCDSIQTTYLVDDVLTDSDRYSDDAVYDISVICKTVPSYNESCQKNIAGVYLGWHGVDDVHTVKGQQETVLYIVTSHIRTDVLAEEDENSVCQRPWTHLRIVTSIISAAALLSITDHINKNNHVIDWDGARTVDRESDTKTRQVKEAIHIVRHSSTMNRDEWAHKLSGAYRPVFAAQQLSDTFVGIDRLQCASLYKFCVTPITASGRLGNTKATPWVRTNGADARLQTPRSIQYEIIILGQKPAVKLTWDPGADPSCYYGLFILNQGYNKESFRARNIKTPRKFQYQIPDLAFSVKYKVKLYTYDKTYRNSSNESCDISFITPDCLPSTMYNYTVCPPLKPENLNLTVLTADHENEETVTVNVSITWEPPLHVQNPDDILGYTLDYRKVPPLYAARLIEADSGKESSNSSQREIVVIGLHNHNVYRFSLVAETKGGKGTPAHISEYIDFNTSKLASNEGQPDYYYDQVTEVDPRDHGMKFWEILTIILVPVLLLTFIACVVVCVVIRKKHMARNRKPSRKLGPVEELNPIYEAVSVHYQGDEPLLSNKDSYEIDYSCLDFITVIGEGAFGKVVKAEYYSKREDREKGECKVVAVKMLKDYHTGDESRSFLREIQSMKSLGHHPYIVSIIGCCITGPKLCLIMDYCVLGDLRNYLRKYRERLMYNSSLPYGVISRHHDVMVDHLTTSDSGILTSSHNGHLESNEINETKLLSYARQISIGMEFLEAERFIHRDLAARNILLYDHRHIKISDFGLSRDVYETNVYQPTSARRLPYKWMAIESLMTQQFTFKSDVWAFGIVLWEIVTLGGSPYPSIPLKDLYGLLNEGYRMEQPENCSTRVYEIMLSAWHPNPHNRPSFSRLRQDIEKLLEETQSYIDLSVDVSEDFFNESTTESVEEEASGNEEETAVDLSTSVGPMFHAQTKHNDYVVDIHDRPLLTKDFCASDTGSISVALPESSSPTKSVKTIDSYQLKPNSHITKTYLSDYRNRFLSESDISGSNCACAKDVVNKKRILESSQSLRGAEKRSRAWSKDSFQNMLDKIGHHLSRVGGDSTRTRKRSVSLSGIDANQDVAQL